MASAKSKPPNFGHIVMIFAGVLSRIYLGVLSGFLSATLSKPVLHKTSQAIK